MSQNDPIIPEEESREKNEQQTTFNTGEEPPKNKQGNVTSTGLQENIAGMLSYLLWIVGGIVFLIIEKENRFVRFHALQSTIVSVVFFVLNIVLDYIPFIGWILSMLLSPLILILWIVLMYKAYKGEYFKLPIIGDFAEKQLK